MKNFTMISPQDLVSINSKLLLTTVSKKKDNSKKKNCLVKEIEIDTTNFIFFIYIIVFCEILYFQNKVNKEKFSLSYYLCIFCLETKHHIR